MTSPGKTAPRALRRLARMFPSQIEALNRYRKHGQFARDAIAGRKQIQALLGETRKLLREMK